MAMFSLQHTSPLRARFGEPAAAIRRAGLEIAEAVAAAQLLLSGDLGAADVVYAVGRATGCSLSDQPNRKSGDDPYAVWLAPDKRLLVCESSDRHALHRDLAVAFSDRRAVRVAGNDHPDACSRRIEAELRKVVQHMDAHGVDLEDLRLGDAPRPGTGVVVAAHRDDRCKAAKLVQQAGLADVAGVDDVVASAQRLDRLWPQQPMGVGDQADPAVRHG